MKKILSITIIIFCLFSAFIFLNDVKVVKADDLSDSILEQLDNIDLSELEEYYNGLTDKPNESITNFVSKMLSGVFDSDYNSIFEYIKEILLNNIIKILPVFLSIIAISILCGIINNFKSSFISNGISDIIFFTCFLSVLLILSENIIYIFTTSEIVIKRLMNLTEIMSPIILTLMTASGATVSATVYKPAVAFLSGGIINLILNIIMPLVIIMTFFTIVSNMTQTIKLTKFSDTICSIIKWIIGITVTIFGVFISIQGITSATYDGISIKAAKYAISNSIPIIGGFIKDGFDLVVAGSVLIKNTIGIACVVSLFYTIISPLLFVIIFSLLLKFTASLVEPISDYRISNLCMGLSKCLSYVVMSLVMVGFTFFIVVILMIISANSFF
jgi:stage III sporulation protein AE